MKSIPTALWSVVRETHGEPELDVVGLGEISLDRVCVVDDLSAVGSVDKAPLHSLERHPGGTIATALLGCAQLGLRSGLIGATGDDEAGELARSSLAAAGVDLSGTREIEGAATREAIILVDRRSGDRSVLFRRDPALALPLGRGGLDRNEILRARALLLDTSDPEASLWAAGVARSAGIPVVLDADRAWPQAEALLSLVDFPVVSERLAEEFAGTGSVREGLRAISSHGATLAVATRGERGSLALSDTGWIESEGFAIEPVDTTGAGDAFRAAFVWGVLAGMSAERVLEVANAAGALSCLALGAQAGLPMSADVAELVRSQPVRESRAVRNARTTSGRAMLIALALLLLAAGGAYNYHRNLLAEQADRGSRPFKGYADQALEDLKVAYRGQIDSRKDRYQALAGRRVKTNARSDLLDDKIADFERIQRAGNEKRAVAGEVAENQARLVEIEAELAYRQYVKGGVTLHIKRLTTL